ncbi:MAG TPA: DUF1987 domain-containing protein [Bacteroidales bacterium]|nr:DUF1987 domain-containing protein [Bacteroidales bacterium]
MDLVVNATRSTFGIEFLYSEGVLRFSGDSYPENSSEFFEPLLRWIENFTRVPHPKVSVEFNVNYFNTNSSKYLFQILSLLKKYQSEGNYLQFVWFNKEPGDEMLETWLEMMEELELDYTTQQV